MYTYKCYYHPKDDGAQACRGCKLPLCVGCQGLEGFCPECERKRASVQQLKQLRMAMAAHPTATTTGRLRLARRAEAGAEGTVRRLSPSGALPGAKTRPLPPLPHSLSTKLEPLRPARRAPERPQERRYNMDQVAYKPVAPKPDRYVRPARKAKAPAQPAAKVRPDWFMPFAIGLGFGVMLVVAMLLAQPFMRGPAPAKHQAAETQLTAREEALLDKALSAPVVDSLAAIDEASPVRMTAVPPEARAAAPVRRARAHRVARRAPQTRKPTLEEAMVFSSVPTP